MLEPINERPGLQLEPLQEEGSIRDGGGAMDDSRISRISNRSRMRMSKSRERMLRLLGFDLKSDQAKLCKESLQQELIKGSRQEVNAYRR